MRVTNIDLSKVFSVDMVFAPIFPLMESPVIRSSQYEISLTNEIMERYGVPVSLSEVRPYRPVMKTIERTSKVNWRQEGF